MSMIEIELRAIMQRIHRKENLTVQEFAGILCDGLSVIIPHLTEEDRLLAARLDAAEKRIGELERQASTKPANPEKYASHRPKPAPDKQEMVERYAYRCKTWKHAATGWGASIEQILSDLIDEVQRWDAHI